MVAVTVSQAETAFLKLYWPEPNFFHGSKKLDKRARIKAYWHHRGGKEVPGLESRKIAPVRIGAERRMLPFAPRKNASFAERKATLVLSYRTVSVCKITHCACIKPVKGRGDLLSPTDSRPGKLVLPGPDRQLNFPGIVHGTGVLPAGNDTVGSCLDIPQR